MWEIITTYCSKSIMPNFWWKLFSFFSCYHQKHTVGKGWSLQQKHTWKTCQHLLYEDSIVQKTDQRNSTKYHPGQHPLLKLKIMPWVVTFRGLFFQSNQAEVANSVSLIWLLIWRESGWEHRLSMFPGSYVPRALKDILIELVQRCRVKDLFSLITIIMILNAYEKFGRPKMITL